MYNNTKVCASIYLKSNIYLILSITCDKKIDKRNSFGYEEKDKKKTRNI